MTLAMSGFRWQPGEAVWQKGELVLTDCMVDSMSEPAWQHFLATFAEGEMMDREDIRRAIHQLKAQGEPLTGPRVLEAIGGKGASYREIYDEIKAVNDDVNVEETTDETTAETIANGPIVPDADIDPVGEAQHQLSRAEAALAASEAQIPHLEAAVAEAREQLDRALDAQVRAAEGKRLRVLAANDPSVLAAERAVQVASGVLREQQHRLTQALAAIEMRQSMRSMYQHAVVQAQRNAFLQREQPALWQRWQELQTARATDPRLSPEADLSDKLRARSEFEQSFSRIEGQIANVLAEAGI